MANPSDRDLISSATKGNTAAFATLVGRYRDARTRFAIRMLGDYDAADEALQASFVRAFRSLSKFRDKDQFADWLFRIIINECRARALRRAVRSQRPPGEVDALADWRAAVEGSENGADVQRALDQIDPINREAFILQYIEELAYPQIAALTGASVITLERQVDRACDRLRELLPEWDKNESPPSIPGLGPSLDTGPSFAVRIAMPLRRPEILNDSFEDRLMAKLLRPAEAGEEGGELATGETKAPFAARPSRESAAAPILPPSPATLPDPPLFSGRLKLPHTTRLVQAAVAVALAAIGFGIGYTFRGRGNPRPHPVTAEKGKATTPKVVRRVDTVRIVKSDTVVLARFIFADPSAKSVSLAGDFNHWDASATALTRTSEGSWARTMRLAPGRYEYAFLVDGKRWVADRFARSSHDAFDVESSVIAATAASSGQSEDGSASSRLKKLLPRVSAERVLASIATARAHGLPATALENRALKFAVRHIPPADIEQAIAGDAEAMDKSNELLAAAGRRDPSGEEIDAAAQLIGQGVDSAGIVMLAKSAPSSRPLEVPLRVASELAATSSESHEAVTRVEEKLRSGASDTQLEHLLDEALSRAASNAKGKEKQAIVAKRPSTTEVRQAGAPSKPHTTTRLRQK